MRFDVLPRLNRIPNTWRLLLFSVVWIAFISAAHYLLNVPKESRKIIRMGYMPVITNLAAPILDHVTVEGDGVRFVAVKFASFAEMAEAIRNDHIQVAFMIAPLSIVLRQQGEDVKVIYIGNRHESTLVVSNRHSVRRFEDLAGKTVAVPMRFSGHYLCMRKLMADTGMNGRINLVEMNPPDMASAMLAGSLDAYFVGEPFAAQSLKAEQATVLHHVEDVWPDFICNLMVVKGGFIEKDPETVQLLVQGAARSGLWAGENISRAAQIASRYWNQSVELVEYTLQNPPDRIRYGKFVPDRRELEQMAELMVRFGLIEKAGFDGLVDSRFAKAADLEGIAADTESILRN